MAADSVTWLTATEISGRVRSGNLDPQAVVRAHLQRIADLDPRVHAYVAVDRAARAGSGALAGVTVAVKDTQPVAGLPWTCGSLRWRDRVAEVDGPPVQRARAAGAAVLGKTNTPELAAAVGTTNELFPDTENPWRAGFTPGGSSGGSGAAVAAGLCTIAFGDDMGGSIRIPASVNGVAGLRPSPGRVPTETPDPTRLSVRGPIARSVLDLRLAFEVMTAEPAPRMRPRRVRVAVIESSTAPIDPACRDAVLRAAEALGAAGHTVTQVGGWDPEPFARAYQVIRPVSVSTQPGEPAEYGAAVRELIAEGRRTSGRDYVAAVAAGLTAAERVQALLDEHDCILTPTLGLLPMAIAQVPAFLKPGWDSYTQFVLPVSFAGLPAISVPAGLVGGLPVGVQLAGRYRHEWRLFELAAELEAAPGFGFQVPPGFA